MSSVLKDKSILLGITGSIAAYKAAEIIRLLKKRGATVYPVMTQAATYFIHPLTLTSLANQETSLDLFERKRGRMIHLSLAELPDLVLIAPVTANVIGKIAHGIADDLLTTTVMATKAPIVLAPAMDEGMYENTVVQTNIRELKSRGMHLVGPEEGELASGKVGKGRMSEPPKIVDYAEKILQSRGDFVGKLFMVTAGPTREVLDKVRFISSYSSGKMGYALAEEGIARGARIILISGPSSLFPPPQAEFYSVETALNMRKRMMEKFSGVDGVLMAAAVSDFRPKLVHKGKIKKNASTSLKLDLVRNPDILKELGRIKKDKLLVGFCAETSSLKKKAEEKLKEKNLDLIVANDITLEGAGFGVDTNIVLLMDRNGEVISLDRRSKREVAEKVWDKVKELMPT
jgi:phosphopantothenoylcysteine decarboxylase/phosphopantothenate--cysteine ligase